MAIHERSGNLSIWWFPREFCQSRLGEYRRHGSNSCTLIALIVANRVSREEQGFFQNANELPARAVDMFAAAINEGNRAYRYAMRPGVAAGDPDQKFKNMFMYNNDGYVYKSPGSENLNIPDAINVLHTDQNVDFHLTEWFYTHLRAEPQRNNYNYTVAARLTRIMLLSTELFRQAQSNRASPSSSSSSTAAALRYLFAAMIADSRTVMFIIELPVNVVTVFDSHQHGVQLGAMVAQCSLHDLDELLQWNMNMVHEMYGSRPEIYEVSFLTTNLSGLPQPHLLDKLMMEQMESGTPHH